MGRFPPEGKFKVWITRNGGRDWVPSGKGLPERAYFNVLREALAIDDDEPGGVYCGTTAGQVFYSRNEGESWDEMVHNLPRITSVSVTSV